MEYSFRFGVYRCIVCCPVSGERQAKTKIAYGEELLVRKPPWWVDLDVFGRVSLPPQKWEQRYI